MAQSLAEILRRFRPAVAPGPAAPAGVPADRVAETGAELAGVFAALAPTTAEAARLVDAAAAEAEARRRAGQAEAQAVLAGARARADEVRSSAAASLLRSLDAERAKLEAAADAEVARIRRAADEHLDQLVARVVREIREAVVTAAGPAGARARDGPP